ncbi:MAG: tRNA (guanosine(37)-N1)-methyltransferase TrmD [Ignavibacteriae bacterium]|nr:tRNA (guanosine(37)-N1)-methyltransferase TrmD [Ignavibacteriota bacterium]
MRIDIISAVPQLIEPMLTQSIVGRAITKGVVEIHVHNLHEYAEDKFRHIDDTPFGGGAGMIIKCAPVFACIEKLQSERKYDEVIYMSPDGEMLNQEMANRMSLFGNIIILAGHYKGIDQRIRDILITKEVSIGDYVLSGGELPALVMVDAIVRLLPGAIGDSESALDDAFQDDLLDSPHYTRPADFRGMKVPDVLLGGNHAEIRKWRHKEALEKTQVRRPDMLEKG